jgi:myo-inositol 2-dehydrogenase/D-chiro-inositol 1-dehydrogenase
LGLSRPPSAASFACNGRPWSGLTIETHYFARVFILGEKSYKGGKLANLFTEGAVQNIATFHSSITKGDWSNPTVAPSVRSNLTTILGRTAAYKKAEVTWDEMMRAGEKLEFATGGLKA